MCSVSLVQKVGREAPSPALTRVSVRVCRRQTLAAHPVFAVTSVSQGKQEAGVSALTGAPVSRLRKR